MNKREYIKPEIEVIAFETESAMLSGSNFAPESGDDYEFDEAGTNRRRLRRGEWGNLWADTK